MYMCAHIFTFYQCVYVYIHIDEEMKFKISEADEMDEFLHPWKPQNIAFSELGLLSKSDKKSLRSRGHFHFFDSI